MNNIASLSVYRHFIISNNKIALRVFMKAIGCFDFRNKGLFKNEKL